MTIASSAASCGPTVAELAVAVRAIKRRRLKTSVLREWERVLERTILPRFGAMPVSLVDSDAVASFIRELEDEGLAAETIVSYLKPLNAISRTAVRRGWLEQSPFAALDPDERPQRIAPRRFPELDAAMLRRLLGAAAARDRRPAARCVYHPVLAALVYTGMRVGEALALRRLDLDLDRRMIQIRHSWSRSGELTVPKTAAAIRAVPVPDSLLCALRPRLIAQPDEWLFPSRSGKQPISYWNLNKRGFQPAVLAAGLADRELRLHDLRHAAASLLIAAGLTPVEVAAQLGHADASVTLKVYAHLFERRESHKRISRAFAVI